VRHFALRETVAPVVVLHNFAPLRQPLEVRLRLWHLPVHLDRRQPHRRHDHEWPAVAQRRNRDARPVWACDIPYLRFHHSPSTTAHTRTGSPMPLSACSPRSSKATPADVRASDRTVSETSTSPGAERALMREAMLTAPP